MAELGITPDAVVAAAESLLDRPGGPR